MAIPHSELNWIRIHHECKTFSFVSLSIVYLSNSNLSTCHLTKGPMMQSPVNMLDPVQKHFGYGQSHPLHLVTASEQHARIIGPDSSRTQPACYLCGTFGLGCILPPTAQIILHKTSLDLIWFTKQIHSGSKPAWKNHRACFWPTFQVDLDQMQIRSGMFTGRVQTTETFSTILLMMDVCFFSVYLYLSFSFTYTRTHCQTYIAGQNQK